MSYAEDWDFDSIDPEYLLLQQEDDTNYRILAKEGYWKVQSGELIKLTHMSLPHILMTIKLLEKVTRMKGNPTLVKEAHMKLVELKTEYTYRKLQEPKH